MPFSCWVILPTSTAGPTLADFLAVPLIGAVFIVSVVYAPSAASCSGSRCSPALPSQRY